MMKLIKNPFILFVLTSLFLYCELDNSSSDNVDLNEQSEENEVDLSDPAEVILETSGTEALEFDFQEFFDTLVGIEKYFVQDDAQRLYALLEYKGSEKKEYLKKFIELNDKSQMIQIEVLDHRNAYIEFFIPAIDCRNVITYWNQSNDIQLIGSTQNCCTMFCDADINFKVYSKETGYEDVPTEQILPEFKELYQIVPPNHIDEDGYDRSILLPKKGKDIEFCVEKECYTLEWKDGKFLIKDMEESDSTIMIESAVDID